MWQVLSELGLVFVIGMILLTYLVARESSSRLTASTAEGQQAPVLIESLLMQSNADAV